MKRITIKLGKLSRSFVVVRPPYPEVGDAITFKGQGAEWTVTKVKETTAILSIRFPKATAEVIL